MKIATFCVAGTVLHQTSAFIAPSGFAGHAVHTRNAPRPRTSIYRMSTAVDEKVATLKECKEALAEMIDRTNSHPILVRLAWHDAGTYDKEIPISEWPKCGGANGSIRFDPEITHGANAGLNTALALLKPIHTKFPSIGWADLMQMASATAIEVAGGPEIDMVYGRVDVNEPEGCAPEGNLPAGNEPFPKGETAQDHLRTVFYRMGFDDQGIVALSGAHTLGRAFKDRSGEGAASTKFTTGDHVARGDGKAGYGRKGGSSWTEKWLKFDNSYFQTVPDEGCDPELLKLGTDKSLFLDEGYLPFAQKYKSDQAAFFADYAVAHKKLSEIGAKFEPEGGIKI